MAPPKGQQQGITSLSALRDRQYHLSSVIVVGQERSNRKAYLLLHSLHCSLPGGGVFDLLQPGAG